MQGSVPFGRPAPKGRVQAYWQIWYELGRDHDINTNHLALLTKNLHSKGPLKFWTNIPDQYVQALHELIWRHRVVSDIAYRWKQLPATATLTQSDNVLIRKHLQYLETHLEGFIQATALPAVQALSAEHSAAWRHPPLDTYLRIEFYLGDHTSPTAGTCAAETADRDAVNLDWADRRTRAHPVLTGEAWSCDYARAAARPDSLRRVHEVFLAWMRTGAGCTRPIPWTRADGDADMEDVASSTSHSEDNDPTPMSTGGSDARSDWSEARVAPQKSPSGSSAPPADADEDKEGDEDEDEAYVSLHARPQRRTQILSDGEEDDEADLDKDTDEEYEDEDEKEDGEGGEGNDNGANERHDTSVRSSTTRLRDTSHDSENTALPSCTHLYMLNSSYTAGLAQFYARAYVNNG